MAHPLVVHCKRSRYDIYIGRPSKWGNPFAIGRDGTREQVIERYKLWLRAQPQLIAALGDLAGKTLGCWCAPHACHGDVLAQLAARSAAAAGPWGSSPRSRFDIDDPGDDPWGGANLEPGEQYESEGIVRSRRRASERPV